MKHCRIEQEKMNTEINLDYEINNDNVKTFMLGGKAIFSVLNLITGNHVTYKINRVRPKQHGETPDKIWFVSTCYGYDKFTCIGRIIDDKFIPSSKMDPEGKSVKGFSIIWKRYCQNMNPMDNVKILHSGKCSRCGRLLTEPESLRIGMGKYCASIDVVATK